MEKENKMKIVHIGQQDAETGDMYEVLKSLPEPKAEFNLSESQMVWRYWYGLNFVKTKEVAELDLVHLQKAAFWMDCRCEALKRINKAGYMGGVVQEFKSGATNVSGHMTVVEKADKHLDEVSSHFGLSIRDRSKLKKTEAVDPNQTDLFEKLLGFKSTGNY